jgi:hypothetical protein
MMILDLIPLDEDLISIVCAGAMVLVWAIPDTPLAAFHDLILSLLADDYQPDLLLIPFTIYESQTI